MSAEFETLGDFVDTINSIPDVHTSTRDELRAQACFVGKYGLGERVHMDVNRSIAFVIQEVSWRDANEPIYQLSWFSNGTHQEIYCREWRLSRAEGSGDAEPPRQQQERPPEQAPIVGFSGGARK